MNYAPEKFEVARANGLGVTDGLWYEINIPLKAGIIKFLLLDLRRSGIA